MKRRTSILVCALLGVMVAGQAMAATLRYQNSGDYFATVAVTGSYGWQAGGGGPGGLPGAADTIRCNWGNNLVTLTNVAPLINNFQLDCFRRQPYARLATTTTALDN
jgi:hypothetical protein